MENGDDRELLKRPVGVPVEGAQLRERARGRRRAISLRAS